MITSQNLMVRCARMVRAAWILPLLASLALISTHRLAAQTLTTLHSFPTATYTSDNAYTNGSGAYPINDLVASGNTLYGTTSTGSTNGGGTVFAITTNGVFTNLYVFSALSAPQGFYELQTNPDGYLPNCDLILTNGTLYGTTEAGGDSAAGSIFALTTNGSFNSLASFDFFDIRGSGPEGGVILSGSTLFGTAYTAGLTREGAVFEIDTNGDNFDPLYDFSQEDPTGTNTDGAFPTAGLVLSGTVLYGTTAYGGSNGFGAIFAYDTNTEIFTSLYAFTPLVGTSGEYQTGTNADGAYPLAALTIVGDTLYGTAQQGGVNGDGTVFAYNLDTGVFTNLHSFAQYPDGASPQARLFASGNTLYGTALTGGVNGDQVGTIFSITTDGTFSLIHQFDGNTDGGYPFSGVTVVGNTLYGTLKYGGTYGYGSVYAFALPVISGLTLSQSVTYGTTNVTLSGTVGVNGTYPAPGETVNVKINSVTQSGTVIDSTGDFSVNFNPSTFSASSGGYTISYTYGGDASLPASTNSTTKLIVTKAPVTVAATAKTVNYGTKVPYTGSTQFTAVLSNSQTIGNVTLTGSTGLGTYAGTNTPVATSAYTITPGSATGGNFSANNYSFSYVPLVNGLTIVPVPLTITASSESIKHGTAYTGLGTLKTTNFTVTGGSNGQASASMTVTLTASGTGGTAGAPIGTYSITPSSVAELAGKTNFSPVNYTVTYNNGTLTVTPLTAILTGTRPYDGTTAAASGILLVSNMVSGDSVTVASGSGTLAGSSVGTYAITSLGTLALGGISASNYTLTGASGSVQITNPGNPFSITSSSLGVAGTNLTVCWQSVPGVVYTVLTNSALAAPDGWAPSGGPITATSTTTCYTLPGGIAGGTNVFVAIKQ